MRSDASSASDRFVNQMSFNKNLKTFIMKKIFYLAFVFAAPIMLHAQNIFPSSGSAGIGTTTPNASSAFEMVSTAKGLLVPRMTKTQRDAIVSPATGLMIFQTNSTPGFYYYSGTAWTAVSPKGVNKSLSNLIAPTAVNVDLLPGSDNAMSIGSSTSSWKNIYFKGNIFFGGTRFISNAGIVNTIVGD